MKNQMILIAAIAVLIGGIGGYAISKSERYERGGMMGGWNGRDKDQEKRFENDNYSRGMDDMHNMHDMGGPLSERKFIEEMIPHHQEAVDTAKQVVARGGTTPEIKTLAENIIVAQEKEIADMKSWYKSWYNEDYKDTGNYKPMMSDLSKLSGEELDKVFLQDMVMHHMGALMMAQKVASNIEHAEMQTLAENIARTQAEEVVKMKTLLKQL